MKKRIFNGIGWLTLLVLAVLWFTIGYTDWEILILFIAMISFSIGDGKIKKLKWLTLSQIVKAFVWFIISVAIAFALIQLGNYLISGVFHLEGVIQTISIWVVIIISMVIAITPFSKVINKIDEDLKKKYNDSINK